MKRHKVSVVIPVKNRPVAIQSAIRSVRQQEGIDVELIVVDDGSTDETVQAIEKLQSTGYIHLIKNGVSEGGAAARNHGALHAQGDYIAFLDSDDEWMPNHLAESIKVLEAEHAEGVFSTFLLGTASGDQEVRFDTPPASFGVGESILSNYRFDVRSSTLVFKREPFLDVQFDALLKKHQDWDLAIRFSTTCKLVLKRTPTVRIHVESTDNRMSFEGNFDASMYFLEKNRNVIRAPFLFHFCLKQLYRVDRSGRDQATRERYIAYMKDLLPKCGIKEKVLFFLIRHNLLDLRLMKNLKNIFKVKG